MDFNPWTLHLKFKRNGGSGFQFFVIIACIGAGFSIGYAVGRAVEKKEWLELVNPPAEKKPQSS